MVSLISLPIIFTSSLHIFCHTYVRFGLGCFPHECVIEVFRDRLNSEERRRAILELAVLTAIVSIWTATYYIGSKPSITSIVIHSAYLTFQLYKLHNNSAV